MKLDRLRTPALAATAVILISGVGVALARGPAAPAAARPPVVAPIVNEAPTTPDTDHIQQGDQTTPDVVGASSASALKPTINRAPRTTSPARTSALPKAASQAASETPGAENPEGSSESEAASDGPGGHQDPPGQNIDHQFDGEE